MVRLCGICRKEGHNRLRCPEPGKAEAAKETVKEPIKQEKLTYAQTIALAPPVRTFPKPEQSERKWRLSTLDVMMMTQTVRAAPIWNLLQMIYELSPQSMMATAAHSINDDDLHYTLGVNYISKTGYEYRVYIHVYYKTVENKTVFTYATLREFQHPPIVIAEFKPPKHLRIE